MMRSAKPSQQRSGLNHDGSPTAPDACHRATVTGGDSESIAAVARAILGALHRNPWPDG
jgi:ADP-ribosylglycohydrolase